MNLAQGKKNFIITAVLYILFGLILCFWPEQSRRFIFVLLGLCLLLYGVFHIIRFFKDKTSSNFFEFNLVSGLSSSLLGVFLFLRPDFPDAFIPFAFGITIMVNGFIKLQYALSMKRYNASNWKYLLIFALILAVIGLMLIIFPITLTNLATIFIGVAFLFAGISDIVSYFQVKSFYQKFKDALK